MLLPLEQMPVLASGVTGAFSGWITNLFIYVLNGILGFVGELIANGIRTFILFDSPYRDPAMQAAFQHNLDLFPQLLVIMFMAGVATKPFADQREVTNFMLCWKALKVIIFVAVGRQIMHFGLLLTNGLIRQIFTKEYGTAFGPQVLQAGLDGAGAASAGAVIGGIILSAISVAGILLALGVFVLREFLFNATFILLPILGGMLFLDFGPLRSASEIAKTTLRATAYMLLAGVVMAGLLQTGAAVAGAYVDVTGQAAAQGDPSFGEVLEAYLFWLIGLIAPAFTGIKAATMAGLSPRRISGRQGAKSGGAASKGSKAGESTRSALMEQARHGARGADQRFAGGRGGAFASRVGSASGTMKGKASGAIAENVPKGGTVVKGGKIVNDAGKRGGQRAAKDVKAGADYATRSLDQSPLDWAEAGLERYRENPVIDTTHQTSPEQQTLSDWSDQSSQQQSK